MLAGRLLDVVSIQMGAPRRHLGAVLAALIGLAAVLPGRPAAGADDGLSFPAALTLALARNPDVRSARADVAQAEAQLLVARQLPNPILSGQTTKIPIGGTGASTSMGNGFFDRSYDTIVALSQTVEIGGKRKNRFLSGEASLAASRARLRDAARSVGISVAHAYTAALLANQSASILRESAGSLDRSSELAKVRFEAGEISESDYLQVEIAAGRFRADAKTAEGTLRTSLVVLATLLGSLGDSGPLQLSDSLETLESSFLASTTESGTPLPDRVGMRPDVEAALRGVEKAEADRSLQVALRIPDPTFLVQYEREPPDRPNSAGLGVSFTLPLFHRNEGAIRAADASREAALIEVERVKARAQSELRIAASNLETARTRTTTLVDELLPKARHVRETVAFSWAEGAASLLELLEAERNLNDLRLAAAGARADLVLAVADERAARGLFPAGSPEER